MDPVKIRNAKHKRSKIIMKKVYELSKLCAPLNINVNFNDRSKNECMEFASNPEFTLQDLNRLQTQAAKEEK